MRPLNLSSLPQIALYSCVRLNIVLIGMQHETGFSNVASANAHLDLGEVLVFLKHFRVVPHWLASEAAASVFTKVYMDDERKGTTD
jgi:hypothetical protein